MPGKNNKQTKLSESELNESLSGVFVFPNGDKYSGNYIHLEDGSIIRNGIGEHVTSDGVIYKGSWSQDKMTGNGFVTYLSGASYEGEFLENKMHGFGLYTFPNKSVYKGKFTDNRMEGDGIFIDANGQEWHGNFKNKTATDLQFKLKM